MIDDYDPRELMRGAVPLLDEAVLLPSTHPLLTSRMEIFDFENDGRDTFAIRDLLISAMLLHGGVGLASNQIGLECRAFAMLLGGRQPLVMFNPIVTELSPDTAMVEEGCLSFPGLTLKIARPVSCRVIYHDPEGVRRSELLFGYDARIVMHEVDHLNGILMTTKVSRLKLDMAKKRMKKRT